jgi:5'-3' exoribonuclease 2
MGVPSLFRYLHAKYPKLTSTVVENKSTLIKDASGTVNFVHHPNEPNPSGFEVDNLYLDMNGIIHPCTHPEDRPAPKTQKAMFEAIFEYIDRLVCMVRPRAVLYMAIDGVAPRAKMNQQRSRRFRAALDAQAKIQSEAAAREEWEAIHGAMPEKSEAFDSNCITPGTPFMAALAQALRYYIVQKLNYSPGWKNLKIVLSDASTPGEGEHKIMDFIRRQRNSPDHNPNTMHVIYGLDADLIMLALATHEPHFKILREDVFHKDQSSSGCFTCGLPGHQAAQCPGKPEPTTETAKEIDHFQKPFIYFHIDVLRKYLYFELQVETPIVTWDPERAIDDWVFLCFFVGNDFLPHLPSLEIREGAIDRLIQIWRSKFNDFGGYLTNNGNIDLARVAILLKELGEVEDEIFRKRREDEKRRRENQKQRKRQALDMAERAKKARETNSLSIIAETMANVPSYSVKLNKDEIASSNREAIMVKKAGVDLSTTNLNANKAAALALKAQLKASVQKLQVPAAEVVEEIVVEGTIEPSMEVEEEEESSTSEEEDSILPVPPVVEEPKKEKRKKPIDEEDDSEPEDHIRLWENGWKDRYYKRNFDIEGDNVKATRE